MKKILIIEDELAIAELQRDYLEIEDFNVKIANDGKKGLDLALNKDFNLIVLDLMLPSSDGFEICKKIRKEKNIPIIIVSAKTDEIDKIRGLGLGADDYVTKPFSPQELVARIKSNLKRYDQLINKVSENEEIIIKNFKIIPNSRKVFLNDKEIKLTNKEFELLLLLARNRNIVLSKQKIFDKVWGFNSFGDLSTIAVHIRKLREKIEKDPENPEYIETVWGVGYRFI
ncbi:MAG: response regulator transcription factor [Bacillota bacterium]